jgi:hypothetical protein
LKRRNDGYLRLRIARRTGRTVGRSKRRDLVSFGSEGRAAAAGGHNTTLFHRGLLLACCCVAATIREDGNSELHGWKRSTWQAWRVTLTGLFVGMHGAACYSKFDQRDEREAGAYRTV